MALDARTKELVSVSAAIAGNCLPCLEWHYKKCVEMNIPAEDIRETIETAKTVKSVPARKIEELAGSLLKQRA